MKTRKEAEHRARQVRRMVTCVDPRDLKLRVWENLGWHFTVHHASFDLHECSFNQNHFFVRPNPPLAVWCDPKTDYRSPNRAIVGALHIMQNYVDLKVATLLKFERAVYEHLNQPKKKRA